MKMRSFALWMLAAWLALQLGMLVGCESSEAKKFVALRKTLITATEPDSPKSIREAKEKVSEKTDVVVRGVIKARDFDPFEKDKSVFTITDIVDDGHDGDPTHNADDCPFCKHRAANALMALVKLVDETGNPYPFSAADLLQVKAGAVVAVEGTATFDPALDLLSITAKQVFIAQH